MELDEFIKDTLKGITKGLHDANKESSAALGHGENVTPFKMPQNGRVDFDIAVSVAKNTEDKGGGHLGIQVVSLGAETSTKNVLEHVSRIKFHVEVRIHEIT